MKRFTIAKLIQYTLILFLGLSALCFTACTASESPDPMMEEPDPNAGEEEEEEEEETPPNMAPNPFDLIGLEDEATEVDLRPSFEWNAATDPEGDAITYSFISDEQADPNMVVISGLTETMYSFESDLNFSTAYSWKVSAEDTNGNTTDSPIRTFTTRRIGQQLPEPAFSVRHQTQVTEFNGKLYLVGGYGFNGVSNRYLNDVWSSTDGETWTLETDNPGFVPRAFHQLISFNGKLLLIGGFRADTQPGNDIWSTTDGSTWVEETAAAEFPGDWGHHILEFDNKLWLITAGQNQFFNRNVWNSADGISWTLVTENIGIPVSVEQEAIVFDNKMWVLTQGSLYSSTDGITWDTVLENAPFGDASDEYSLIVFENEMFLMTSNLADDSPVIWTSADGMSWEMKHEVTNLEGRVDNAFLVFNGIPHVVGGLRPGGTFVNEIWTLN